MQIFDTKSLDIAHIRASLPLLAKALPYAANQAGGEEKVAEAIQTILNFSDAIDDSEMGSLYKNMFLPSIIVGTVTGDEAYFETLKGTLIESCVEVERLFNIKEPADLERPGPIAQVFAERLEAIAAKLRTTRSPWRPVTPDMIKKK